MNALSPPWPRAGRLAAMLARWAGGPWRAGERMLRESGQRDALALEAARDGVVDWDVTGDRLVASPRAMQVAGVPPAALLRTRAEWQALLALHPEDRVRYEEDLRRHLAGRSELSEGEYRFGRSEGGHRWVLVRGATVRDGAGRPVRHVAALRDIDARKRAEQALIESERRYALAVEGSNDGAFYRDIVHDRYYASPRALRIMGVVSDSCWFTNAQWNAIRKFHPDDAARYEENRRRNLEGLTDVHEAEYRYRQPDGSYRWVHVRSKVIRDANGRPLKQGGSVRDIDDRKRAEQALRESERRHALVLAGSNQGFFDVDFVNRRLYVSPRLIELRGWPSERTLYDLDEYLQGVYSRLHPDDLDRYKEERRAHIEGSQAVRRSEFRIRQPDGSYRWFALHAISVRDAAGRIVRQSGCTTDIDARKRAEEALRESEQRYALAVAGSNDGIWDWDIANGRIFVSTRCVQIVGVVSDRTRFTIQDWEALRIIHPEDVERYREDERRHLAGVTPLRDGEYRYRHPDGTYRWVRLRSALIRDEEGRPIREAGSASDIDDRKRTEQALRESQERFRLAVAGANQGIWDWDLESDMLFLSRRAQEIAGLQAAEPLRPRREWTTQLRYHPDDTGRIRKALSEHLRGLTPLFDVEYRLLHGSGRWVWQRQRGIAVRNEGRPTRMAGSMEDTTARHEAEAERLRLEAQLRQAQKLEAIGTLAGGIAHDFNNILAAILGYGEMAQKTAPEGSAQRRHLDAAMSAAVRARSLVERILAFSRSGVGERVPVHVQSVVAEALEAVRASLPPGVRLEQELAARDAGLLGDPTQIHQVVLNLCANAVQAMKSTGALTVGVGVIELEAARTVWTSRLAAGRYVRLSVRDTGVGIAPQMIDRIFDPFFTTREVGVGTGLGLSLVHGIVADLGGGIEVESRPGVGSCFTVYLPWQQDVHARSPGAEDRVPLGAGEAILLVDDEEPLVRLGEELMAELGYEPVGFTSAAAALERFRTEPHRFSAVVSDEAMPGMTGSELAHTIRRIRPGMPILLMSGCVTPALSDRARDAGVCELLAKPLLSQEVARGLARALRRGRDEA